MHALTIDNVTKSYGDVTVLKNINLTVNPGEFLILVGPSGCGKSTLLNMIAGLIPVTDGSICIGERDVTNLPPKDRDIAMVFQSYALYPTMTVRQNMAFGMEIRKTPKPEIDSTISRVAKLLQMEDLLDRKPSQLSGGQRQRVAMGRALAREPRLFLFDEPLSNLDAKLRVDMRAEIKKLHKTMNTTIAYVTHDQIEAMTLGDKIAVMNGGVVQQFGSPQEVYDLPDNLFVAGFMGSPSMNFIPVPISEDGKSFMLKGAGEDQSFLIPERSLSDLKDYRGKQVIAGIRPEHFGAADNGQEEASIELESLLQELTGADVLIHSKLNDTSLICRCTPDNARLETNQISLALNVERVTFFDPDSTQRIGR